ncbi:hypothetical protein BC941DRAFT_435570 [Chlamydoabsidia padenii]|nr:hypothetical protein BC941DRAFT_435570 [Chlamydoabsidia padenii]
MNLFIFGANSAFGYWPIIVVSSRNEYYLIDYYPKHPIIYSDTTLCVFFLCLIKFFFDLSYWFVVRGSSMIIAEFETH